MSVTPEDLITLSESLLNGDECHWRSSASRSYYAAYHLAKDASSVCPDNSHFALNSGTHGVLIDRFKSWAAPDARTKTLSRQIAYILQDMKRSREVADYVLDAKFFKNEAVVKFRQFELLKKTLQELWASNPSQSQTS